MEKHISGRVSHILLNASLITIPMLGLSGVLLGLVYGHRVTHSLDDLRFGNVTDEPGVLYVNIDSTQLATVASWSSTIAPGLAGMIIALFSYQISRHLLKEDKITPYQFGLVISIINSGAFAATWAWIKYIFGWRATRQPQSRTLRNASLMLMVALLMSILVIATDTWLHVSISTVVFTRTAQAAGSYSYALSESCLQGHWSNMGMFQTCSVETLYYTSSLINGTESVKLLAGVSETTSIANWSDTALLVPHAQRDIDQDYSALTYGASMQCKLISHQCNLDPGVAFTSYNCSSALRGSIWGGTGDVNLTYWKDRTWSSEDSSYQNSTNPYYFAWPTIADRNGGGEMMMLNDSRSVDAGIIVAARGGLVFILGCKTTILDVSYTKSEDKIVRLSSEPSNNTVADMFRQPMRQTDSSWAFLQQQLTLATFSSTGQEMTDKLALSLSKATLALASGVLVSAPAQQVQQRSTFNVARVPKTPLFALIAANLLFVVVGIIVTILAFAISSQQVTDAQARLSVPGLMAERFEECRSASSVEELFEEHEGKTSAYVRILQNKQCGYAFTARQQVADTGSVRSIAGYDDSLD